MYDTRKGIKVDVQILRDKCGYERGKEVKLSEYLGLLHV